MGILASDNFNRADNADVGAVWSPNTAEPGSTGMQIVSNAVVFKAPSSSESAEIYNALTAPANQYSEVTYNGAQPADGTGSGYGPICRAATNAITFYRAVANGSGFVVSQIINNVKLDLIVSSAVTVAAADKLRLSLYGNYWQLSKNGIVIAAGIDDGIASGGFGMAYNDTATGGGIDAWEGGDFGSMNDYGGVPNRNVG